MTRKVWIEVAQNGSWTRRLQPRIPVTVEELIADGRACIDAGAAILHFHALDPETGKQTDDPDVYGAVIAAVGPRRSEGGVGRGPVGAGPISGRAPVGKPDQRAGNSGGAIAYPTLPLNCPPGWRHRYEAVEVLGNQGLLEWAVVDPGSVNIFVQGPDKSLQGAGITYPNPDSDIRMGMEYAERFGYHPEYACFEPGFIRLGAAMQRAYPNAPKPIYSLRFGGNLSFGFPPEEWALDALLRLLEREAPGATWMAAAMGGDILPLVPAIVARGGHIRTGLEDAALGCPRSNPELVEAVVAAVRAAGAEPATADEVRAELAASEAVLSA